MSNVKKAINTIKTIIRVVLYLRLSDEDRNKLTKEELSESIKNQEKMLRNYAKEQGWTVVGVYNDEDYSGADRDRPNFNLMIKECEKGNVDIVLVKTQARFARDIELIDKYIHNKFKEWGVRFLTCIEKIDNTKRETKKTSQITAMTDEWYIEDTSINIRETFKTKRINGEFTGSFTPYGYIRDPENKNHLLIDPVASFIVKRIYDEYLSGSGLEKIARGLNKDNVLSPLEYKYHNGSKLRIPLVKEYMSYEYIEKTGAYKVNVSFYNNERQVLKNVISYNYITVDRKNFNNKCEVSLKKYSENKLKIYYTTKIDFDTTNFNINDWVLMKENDIIPNNTTCIAVVADTIDRTHTISYQLEVSLKENRKHEQFYFDVITKSDNDLDLDFDVVIRKKYQWSSQAIKKILTDEVYIGDLVQFKTTYVSYKNHTLVHNDESEWIRAEDMHDSIIEKNVWYDIQERMKEKSRSCKTGTVHAFANKVFCMNCNKVFCKCGKSNELGFGYLCCKDKNEKWTNCDNSKYLKEEELHNFVITKINDLLKRFYSEKDLEEIKNQDVENDLFKDKLDILNKELHSLNKELTSKSTYFQKLYEDRANGILDDKEYLLLKNKYKDDNNRLEERISNVKKEIELTNKKKQSIKDKKNIFKKYTHIDNLSIEVVNDFIDKIIVGYNDDSTNSRDLKIIWNFNI